MNKRVFVLIGLLVLIISVSAQSLKDTVKLSEVFVMSIRQTTERALYINRIDSTTLASSVNVNLSDVLQKNSSVYIKSYGQGGLATASFRGTSASHTQVLWNGLNINPPMWGQNDMSLLPVFFTDEIALYYGSSSLSKTSGGLGGCIALSNTPGWNDGFSASFSQTVASFKTYLSQFKLSFSKDRFVSKTRVYSDKAKNNFRYYNDKNLPFGYSRQTNADYFKDGFLQEFYYKVNNRQFLGLKVMAVQSDRNLPAIMSFGGAERDENQQDKNINVLGEWKIYTSKSSLSINSGLIYSNLNYLLANTNQGGRVVNFDSESSCYSYSNKINYQFTFTESTVLKSSVDADWAVAHYSSKIDSDGYEKNRSDIIAQTSLHHTFGKRFSGYFLIQQKLLNSTLMPFLPAFGIEYDVTGNKSLLIRSNFGRNLHVPNLNDKYFTPGGNPNLKPEVGIQGDVGLVYSKNYLHFGYRLELTGYGAWINDWILWHPSEFRYWTADNVQRVFSRGVEINASMKGNLGSLKYELKGNYGLTRTTNQQKGSAAYGMQLIYIPVHIGNVHLYLDKGTVSGMISFHNTSSRNTTTIEDLLDHRLEPYWLVDVGLGNKFSFDKNILEIYFKANNLFNSQYQVIMQRAMPGRNFGITLRYSFINKI